MTEIKVETTRDSGCVQHRIECPLSKNSAYVNYLAASITKEIYLSCDANSLHSENRRTATAHPPLFQMQCRYIQENGQKAITQALKLRMPAQYITGKTLPPCVLQILMQQRQQFENGKNWNFPILF